LICSCGKVKKKYLHLGKNHPRYFWCKKISGPFRIPLDYFRQSQESHPPNFFDEPYDSTNEPKRPFYQSPPSPVCLDSCRFSFASTNKLVCPTRVRQTLSSPPALLHSRANTRGPSKTPTVTSRNFDSFESKSPVACFFSSLLPSNSWSLIVR
jgi:hypothetical protein